MALTPEAVYAMLKRYVADTAIGFGAVKGAPCTIKKIEKNNGVSTVTFEWTGMDGSKRTSEMKVNDGKSVNSIQINENNELVVTYGDGTTEVAGSVYGGNDTYTNPGVEVAVGGVRVGDSFKDTPIPEVLDKIFSLPYVKPVVAIALSCKNLYSANDPSTWPTSVKVTASVTKKTDPITKVVFKVNGSVVETRTTGVSNGGNIIFNYGAITGDVTTFAIEVSDGTSTVSTSTKVTIIGTSYAGIIGKDEGIDSVDPSVMTPETKVKKDYSYSPEFPNDGNTYRIVYMYPKSLGLLTTITDGMNFENIQEYTRYEKQYDGIDYYVYISNPTAAAGLVQNYK